MPVADQSTQVNFPSHTTTPRHRKHLHRHNTAGDILSMKMNGTVNNNALHHFHHSQTHCVTTMHSPGTKSLPHFKYPAGTPPTRPKSLSVLQPTPTISVTNGTTTPDASSTMSLASTPPSQRVPAVYENDTTTTSTTKEDNKKWNTAITAFNAGKVWKSNSSSGLRYDTGYDSPVSSPHRVSYNVGQECGCRCLCGGDQPRRKFTSGPSWLNNSTASLQDMGVQSPEGLSWRRLHMSRAKLKATATTSELLSGFAMIAMVELQINEPTEVPEWLFVMFSVCTTVLVAVHIFALMISTYLLPNIDAISKLEVAKLVTESPHERMRGFIELAWAFSTVFGLFLFLVEIAILCWVKFWDYSFAAAIAATVIVIPVLIIFVAFAVHFYHSLFIQRCESSLSDMEQLEDMKRNLDQVSSPV